LNWYGCWSFLFVLKEVLGLRNILFSIDLKQTNKQNKTEKKALMGTRKVIEDNETESRSAYYLGIGVSWKMFSH